MEYLIWIGLLGTIWSINAHAVMSGGSPEKDVVHKLQVIQGFIHYGPPNSSVTVGYGVIKNNTNKD